MKKQYSEALDGLSQCLLKAHALSSVTYGEEGDAFRNMHDDVQDAYMWALHDLIAEAQRHCAVVQKGGAA